MRRIYSLTQSIRSQQKLSTSIPISPFLLTPILNINNKFKFCTDKTKKHKPKIIIGSEEEEDIQDANIERETNNTSSKQQQQSKPKVSNINFSSTLNDDHEPSGMRGKLHQYIGTNLLLDDIIPRMIALRNKNPEAITKAMNLFFLANGM